MKKAVRINGIGTRHSATVRGVAKSIGKHIKRISFDDIAKALMPMLESVTTNLGNHSAENILAAFALLGGGAIAGRLMTKSKYEEIIKDKDQEVLLFQRIIQRHDAIIKDLTIRCEQMDQLLEYDSKLEERLEECKADKAKLEEILKQKEKELDQLKKGYKNEQ